MIRYLLLLVSGIAFGIIMIKSEATSWFRIQEMFRFQSFHMYGIICSAIATGAIMVQVLKRMKSKNIDGELIEIPTKAANYKAGIWGGILFGIGWAFTGACPGPLFVNLGAGFSVMLIPILSAIAGAFVLGLVKRNLPM